MHPIFTQLDREIAGVLCGLDARQTQLRPARHPEKWSVQQTVAHLLLAFGQTSNAIEERIAKGRPTQAKPTLAQRAAQMLVVRIGFLPSGRAAPAPVLPGADETARSGAELSAAVSERLARLDSLCRRAEPLFGSARCITHMALGPLSIAQWRQFQLVHGRHHMKQIRRILREQGRQNAR